MKKLLLLAAVAVGAYFVYRKVMASRAEEDLWTEATTAQQDFGTPAESQSGPAGGPV